jgi:hypothetical protein
MYTIKWLKWDNFLSYGEGNQFDFTKYKGLVLLNGEPANQSGKTTFAMELIRFVLFGKVTKCDKQEDIFNRFLPEATTVNAEMCICINNEDYIIKRTLTRPALAKRTAKSATKSSIEYYKVSGESRIELSEFKKDESLNGESVGQTNKVIKEAIGNEDDFDLTMCASSKSLDDLIDKKSTERGRILSRWIGLGSLEKKDEVARDLFNKSVRDTLIVGKYNEEALNDEINAKTAENATFVENIARCDKNINDAQKKIDEENQKIKALATLKSTVDPTVIKMDITTVKNALETITESGKCKKVELETTNKEIAEIGDAEFDSTAYNKLHQTSTQLQSEIAGKNVQIKTNEKTINDLATSEYCPVCKRKYENVDNSGRINEIKVENEKLVAECAALTEQLGTTKKAIEDMTALAEKSKKRGVLVAKAASLEVTLANLRTELLEKRSLIKEYEANKEAIRKNGELDSQIAICEGNLQVYNQEIQTATNGKMYYQQSMAANEATIKANKELIERIHRDERILRNWKLYLEIIGKNGISKMVLRKALPIINANLARILSDVVDFTVEVTINDKNEVDFLLVHDGVKANLHSGSGLEMTASALALRTVLANMSNMGRPQFIVLDEILGRVAKENYENMHSLYNKIMDSYELILQVSHLQEIQDWHDGGVLTVIKKNNVSKIIENR